MLRMSHNLLWLLWVIIYSGYNLVYLVQQATSEKRNLSSIVDEVISTSRGTSFYIHKTSSSDGLQGVGTFLTQDEGRCYIQLILQPCSSTQFPSSWDELMYELGTYQQLILGHCASYLLIQLSCQGWDGRSCLVYNIDLCVAPFHCQSTDYQSMHESLIIVKISTTLVIVLHFKMLQRARELLLRLPQRISLFQSSHSSMLGMGEHFKLIFLLDCERMSMFIRLRLGFLDHLEQWRLENISRAHESVSGKVY